MQLAMLRTVQWEDAAANSTTLAANGTNFAANSY